MADQLREAARRLLGPEIAQLATVMPDGRPHVTPVWVDVGDSTVVVKCTEGRVKVRNLKPDPRVGLSVADRENPYAAVDPQPRPRDHRGERRRAIRRPSGEVPRRGRYPMRQSGERRVIARIERLHVFGPQGE